jgi:hypothetical protein
MGIAGATPPASSNIGFDETALACLKILEGKHSRQLALNCRLHARRCSVAI